MRPRLWFAYAWRDLRSGLKGFWIFLTCLALGTAAIATIGSLTAAIDQGISDQGQPLMGGDLEAALIHREAPPDALAFLKSKGIVSTVAALRGMAVTGEKTALIEIKAADALYPLYGVLNLSGNGALADAVSVRDGVPGVAVDPMLLARLDLAVGDRVKIGSAAFEIRDTILHEPDRISDGIVIAPRVIMSLDGLKASGLIQPGSLITWKYRVKLAQNTPIAAVRTIAREARTGYETTGWRVRTRDNAAAGAENFVERLAYFMTLVGLSALIIGGAGIANAANAFIQRRLPSIATLKCLGAPSHLVRGIYLTEIMIVASIAVILGVAVGAAAPALTSAVLGDILPLPVSGGIEIVPLLRSAAFGFLVAIAFSLWPLSRTRHVPASALFRHLVTAPSGWPSRGEIAVIALAFACMSGLVYASFDDYRITTYFIVALAASFALLTGLARAIVAGAARLPKFSNVIWRYAISNVYRPGSAAVSVILALGLGLTLFVTLALTDRTISDELRSGLPDKAPSFFFVDVSNADLQAFTDQVRAEPGVTGIETAPMMRGRIVKVRDVSADAASSTPDAAWALRGDRGLTYADTLPEGSRLSAGEWWPKDYDGPPLVSFVDDIAKGLGLKIGDKVTVNVLGRDVTATIANLRQVNWRSLGINFVMVFTPNTLRAAPHANLVTVMMDGGDEGALLNRVTRSFPTVTGVRVKDVLTTVTELLGQMLAAIRGANAMTLLTGVLVLAGALAAGLSGRLYDAVVLKTYGATRRQLLLAFIAEYAVLGLASALFGIAVGSLVSWALAYWVLEMPWQFSPGTAVLTALIAMVLCIGAGLAVTWRALTVKPAGMLRNE
ncbi:FtsX-like permease family protein [soil metagenome]